jgi:(4-(4-[2-(gamma-L-glutamylamino)ethyl]phenoxymethyl)furan-2-yl)methanamine synthase
MWACRPRSAATSLKSCSVREETVVGWDIGGAHVKASLLLGGEVRDATQWPCPLWQGLDHLHHALAAAQQRWPALEQAEHAVTMTGEMVDLFVDREDGVQRIAAALAQTFIPATLHFFAGDAGWCGPDQVAAQWRHVASANWLATALHAAMQLAEHDALLVDIGSTTTDLIALRRGRVLTAARTDAERLASGELLYHGVVRTPLCALAQRIVWRGREHNVMNEFFASTADVYRTSGELDAEHDQATSADHAAKDARATQQRLARMIGLDARDGTADDWLAFAREWKRHQVCALRAELARAKQLHGMRDDTPLIGAGCGDFLVGELATNTLSYASDVARVSAHAARWVQVCAPSVAVAALLRVRVR